MFFVNPKHKFCKKMSRMNKNIFKDLVNISTILNGRANAIVYRGEIIKLYCL